MTRLLESSLKEYFREAVNEALQELDMEISELAHFYLADLLTRFSEMKTVRETNPVFQNRTFAELYLQSHLLAPSQKAAVLKLLGDTALFLTGLFGDSFRRKLVDIDYYGKIGQASYSALVTLIAYRVITWGVEEVFEELSERFWDMKDILAQVGESGGFIASHDVLRIYERWLKTHSRRDARKLKSLGIIPIDQDPYAFKH
ncbi:hypothetical protein [Thermodesulforhabdus norvegica]|uniref:Uncharacterized protein n=1 Tax=Thermodesulforhabdus norvegica TaxID=39841 RepID=A0A1I4V4V0_9BACT|nr:hypothetical protein [Thermodesulforhabdus norvegica]SFM96257.1 hypothetical protein SAMN05660836_02110 [Thermodesulforhabdus norvegica]